MTLGSIETPASLKLFTSADGYSYAETHARDWIDTMKDSREIDNNNVTITLTKLYTDPDPSANYVTGSGSVKLIIEATKNQTELTLALGEKIQFESADGIEDWYPATDDTTTVTLNIISAKVSVR